MRNHIGAQSNGITGSAPWQIQLTELSPYRKRIWSQAIRETRRYWNLHRTSTAITSPVVTAVFWVAVKGWKGWLEVLYAALLGVVLFGFGWGIAFFVSLLRAPAQLDAECQQQVQKLAAELELPDKALADYLIGLLNQTEDAEIKVMKFMLFHEEIDRPHIKIPKMEWKEIDVALRHCVEIGLLCIRSEGSAGSFLWMNFYWIPPEFRETLKRLLRRA